MWLLTTQSRLQHLRNCEFLSTAKLLGLSLALIQRITRETRPGISTDLECVWNV